MQIHHRRLLVAAQSGREKRRQSLSSVLKEKNFGLVCQERECLRQKELQEERLRSQNKHSIPWKLEAPLLAWSRVSGRAGTQMW